MRWYRVNSLNSTDLLEFADVVPGAMANAKLRCRIRPRRGLYLNPNSPEIVAHTRRGIVADQVLCPQFIADLVECLLKAAQLKEDKSP